MKLLNVALAILTAVVAPQATLLHNVGNTDHSIPVIQSVPFGAAPAVAATTSSECRMVGTNSSIYIPLKVVGQLLQPNGSYKVIAQNTTHGEFKYRSVFTVKAKYQTARFYTAATDGDVMSLYACITRTSPIVDMGLAPVYYYR